MFAQEKFCETCGVSLGRYTYKRTCSDKCRKQLSRRDYNIQQAYKMALNSLGNLRAMLKQHPATAPTINPLLERLEQEVRDIRRLRPDDDMKARMAMEYEVQKRRV